MIERFWRWPWLYAALLAMGVSLFGAALLAVSPLVADLHILSQALFFVGVLGAGIYALMARPPMGGWLRQVWHEALRAAICIAGIWFAWSVVATWAGLRETLVGSPLASLQTAIGVPMAVLVARGGARAWQIWQRLQRHSVLWSMTALPLRLALLLSGCLGLVGIMIMALQRDNPFFSADVWLFTVLPALGVWVALSMGMLVILFPPSVLVSYFSAKATTRRLRSLTQATHSLRQGDLDARVTVSGEDEIAALQVDFNAMADELRATMAALSAERDRVSRLLQARHEMVARVSHELRTPMATVRAYLEGWKARGTGNDPEADARDMAIIEAETSRLQTLLDDLLQLARAEAGGLAVERHDISVGAVVGEQVAAFAPLAWDQGRVEVQADVPSNLPAALGDATRLAQVIANLLRNAAHHTDPGGIVIVSASADATHVTLQICDTGCGIAPEAIERIWEPFYRGAGADATPGAGLGLALVKELVEAMGGSVAVTSALGEGSCFCVTLPRA